MAADDRADLPQLIPGDDPDAPFTDFGQFGPNMIDRRCLAQDTYWVDATGTPHFLSDMDNAYRINVIGYLHEHAEEWFQELRELALGRALELLATAGDLDELASLCQLLRELNGVDPHDWMEGTLLMRRLRQLAVLDKHIDHQPGD